MTKNNNIIKIGQQKLLYFTQFILYILEII